MELVRDFKNLNKKDVSIAGGKGASLGEMIQAGISVPECFVILSNAFEEFIRVNDLNIEIDAILDKVNTEEIHTTEKASEQIESLIINSEIPKDIEREILLFFKKLNSKFVAVRSSATSEDSASAAWAGQLESYLNTTEKNLLENVKKCWASLFSPRAIFYRFEQKLIKSKISVAVVVQKMIESEESGIAFSVHPVTQDRNQLIIEAGFGLGEAIVSGQITPDSYVVDKQDSHIIDINVNKQEKGIFRKKDGGNEWRELGEKGERQVLNEKEILKLSEIIINIENHYGFPVDIEWAKEKGKFYIVQSRPITTLANKGGVKNFKEIIDLKEWEFEFQQRNMQPILMADFWCRALYRKYVGEINLPVEPYDYLFTTSSKGYVKTAQKKITLEAIKKAFNKDNSYSEYLYNQTIRRVNELETTKKYTLGEINKEVSNNKLVELWEKFDETFLTVIPWYWIPYYPIEQNILSDKIKEGLMKYNDKIEKITDFNNAFMISISPTKEMAFKEEQKDFFDLVKIAIKKEDFPNDRNFNEKAKEYLKKYSWMNTFILLPIEPLSLNELIHKINKAIEEKSIETYLLQEKKKAENEEISKKILQIIGKDKKLLEIIEDIKKIGWVLTWSVETSLHTLADLQPFFKLIAKHLGVSYSHWIHLTSNEIMQILEGKNNLEEMKLKEREKGYFFVMENGIQKMAIGEEGKSLSEWVEKNLNKVDENITELKGQSACSGHAKGSVRIALIAKDSYKLKEGEILVCAMTSPDYVPAMKRASAIITDEGGLLSHAAIMSREFGKPCVIATKIATRILKDGDIVDADADNGVIKILKSSNEKENWLVVVSFKTELLTEAIIHRGYRESLPKLLPQIPKFKNRMIIDNDIYIDLTETGKIQEYFSTDTINKATRVYDAIKKQSEKLIEISKKVVKNRENIDNVKLSKRLDKFFNEYKNTIGVIGVPTIIDLTLESRLKEILKESGIKNIEEALSTLAVSYKPVETSQEKEDLLKLAEKISKNKLSLDSEQAKSLIEKHYDEYGWLHSTLFVGELYNKSQIKTEIKNILDNVKEEKKKLENDKKEHLSNAEKMINKINSREGKELAKFFQKAVYYRTARLEWMNKACFIVRLLLEDASNRLRIKFDDIIYLLPEEITNSLNKGQLTKDIFKEIEERHKGYAYISDNKNEYLLVVNKELDKWKRKFSKEYDEDLIKGIVAYKGEAKGKAIIVKDRSELNKVEKGDILVTRLTTPDFVIAMKNSIGIVTDLGGVTSHAAVTSRELKIPCIVGTKNATKLIKDGDIIELDTNNGSVRILEKL